MPFKELQIDKIEVKKGLNFRTKFDPKEIKKLSESINNLGQLQPIVVSTNGLLIAGECRLRAMKELGRKKISANVIRVLDEEKAKELNAAENIHRATLNKGEEAKACAYLRKRWESEGLTKSAGRPKKKEVKGKKVGKGKKLSHSETINSEKAKVEEKIKETGMSKASFLRKVKVGDNASAKVIDALGAKDITQKQAEALAELPKTAQDKILPDLKGKTAAETMMIISEVAPEKPKKKKETKAKGKKETPKKDAKKSKTEEAIKKFESEIETLIEDVDSVWKKLKNLSGKDRQLNAVSIKTFKRFKTTLTRCGTHVEETLGMM